MSIRKVKHHCNICHEGITVKNNFGKYNYYYCKNCNLIYVLDKNLDKFVRSYEPRKVNNL